MPNASNWNQPPGHIHLLTDDVHVWSGFLDVSGENLQLLLQTLDSDERIRADRFYFERDRTRFIASHGLLRLILASYLEIEPDQLRFRYSSNGKPSLAHSHELALFALTIDRRIGVDVAQIYDFAEIGQLTDRILSKQEKAELRKHFSKEKLEALFRYWTCKEAYVKATGEGLSQPLEEIHVSLLPGTKAG